MEHSIEEKKPTSGKAAKAITGCGGCGCLTGLLAMTVGGLMLAWGATDSKVDELVGPGAAILVLSVVIGFFALAILIGGIVAMMRAKKSAASAPVVPAPVAQAPQQPPAAPYQPGPPGAPPAGPPPEW